MFNYLLNQVLLLYPSIPEATYPEEICKGVQLLAHSRLQGGGVSDLRFLHFKRYPFMANCPKPLDPVFANKFD